MTNADVQLKELQDDQVALAARDSDLLLARHSKHLELRAVPGRPGWWQLRPEAYCGVIALPSGRAIYVEPKATIENLWHMLSYAYDLVELAEPPVGLRNVEDLLESLVEVFARRTAALIQRGLLRGYEPQHENLTVMRGRLDVTGNIRHNLAARHRLMCSFDEFTTDIIENRILRYALHLLLRVKPWRPRVRQQLDRCERRLTEARLEHIAQRDFGDLHFTRLNEHYRTPLMLAKLLLEALAVTHRAGERQMLPLLLDMTKVFERFLQRLLEEYFAGSELNVRTRGHSRVLDVEGRVKLVPDILIRRGSDPLCVVDAKYKVRRGERDEDAAGLVPSSGDTHQMLAYCVGYRVRDAVLVYPEPTYCPTIRVRQPGVEVNIHSLGVDLAGSHEALETATKSLCATIGAIARPVTAEGYEAGVIEGLDPDEAWVEKTVPLKKQ